MLLGLIAGNDTGINGIAVYIMVYTFMNLGALLVVVALRRANIIGEDLDDLAGLVHKSPGYAFLMLIFLLSLAGIPPTAGFLGKYYIFLSLIETGHYALAVFARSTSRWPSTTTSRSCAACSSARRTRRRRAAGQLRTALRHWPRAASRRSGSECIPSRFCAWRRIRYSGKRIWKPSSTIRCSCPSW